MKKFGVGIQLYGVKNAMQKDFEGTLAAVKEMGYEYVEFAGFYGKTAEEIRAILAKLGLKCVSVHQGLDFFNEDPQAGVDFLKAFGVKYVVIPWYAKEALAGTDKWEATLASFTEKAKLFQANGMMLGYHNHDFEFKRFEGKYIHDHIFDAIPEELIVPELDTCWVHYAGLDPADKIREFAGRVDIVHLKDFNCKELGGGPAYALIDADGNPIDVPSREDNGFRFAPLGRGRQDFTKILTACEESGTQIVIVEQDRVYDGMTELEAAKISRDYLKNTFGL
ncbi:MAG: sugar phosphate isomerase/epimerase [Ruminococcaceae bacterium]|nr:sugar phosphate isomerase/epimerase [Oscillospiraceae bacterium]